MKKIFYIILANIFLLTNVLAVDPVRNLGDPSIKEALTGNTDSVLNIETDGNGIDLFGSILVWFKSEIMSLVSVLAIGVFIFIGFRIFVSRGNPEEFKNSLKHFVFAVVGIFVIFIAWGAVKLISSLSI